MTTVGLCCLSREPNPCWVCGGNEDCPDLQTPHLGWSVCVCVCVREGVLQSPGGETSFSQPLSMCRGQAGLTGRGLADSRWCCRMRSGCLWDMSRSSLHRQNLKDRAPDSEDGSALRVPKDLTRTPLPFFPQMKDPQPRQIKRHPGNTQQGRGRAGSRHQGTSLRVQ